MTHNKQKYFKKITSFYSERSFVCMTYLLLNIHTNEKRSHDFDSNHPKTVRYATGNINKNESK